MARKSRIGWPVAHSMHSPQSWGSRSWSGQQGCSVITLGVLGGPLQVLADGSLDQGGQRDLASDRGDGRADFQLRVNVERDSAGARASGPAHVVQSITPTRVSLFPEPGILAQLRIPGYDG